MLVAALAFSAGVVILSHTIYGASATDTATAKKKMLPLQRLAGTRAEQSPSSPAVAGNADATATLRPAEPRLTAQPVILPMRSAAQPATDSLSSADPTPGIPGIPGIPETPGGSALLERSADHADPEQTIERVEDIGEARPETEQAADTDVRVYSYNGRLIRPRTTMTMRVTAYSPDRRSCGNWADGITASGRRVTTNGGRLVAADTRILPFGAIVSIPGYHDGEPVPVLDRGGAIKGYRLDLLYPTHARARQWGVQDLEVTIWEYADQP